MHLRIKHIVIITDYCVHPVGSIQTHFVRTYLVFLRLGQEIFPKISVPAGQELKHRLIHPVKMTLGIRTFLRITVRFLQTAKLFLCSNSQGFIRQTHLL